MVPVTVEPPETVVATAPASPVPSAAMPAPAPATSPAAAPAPASASALQGVVVHTVRGRAVIPPAIVAERMQRYSVWLMLLTGGLIALNATNLELGMVLWFAAGITAVFALLCAITVVILNAIAWNFARLAEELRGGRTAQDMQ